MALSALGIQGKNSSVGPGKGEGASAEEQARSTAEQWPLGVPPHR